MWEIRENFNRVSVKEICALEYDRWMPFIVKRENLNANIEQLRVTLAIMMVGCKRIWPGMTLPWNSDSAASKWRCDQTLHGPITSCQVLEYLLDIYWRSQHRKVCSGWERCEYGRAQQRVKECPPRWVLAGYDGRTWPTID